MTMSDQDRRDAAVVVETPLDEAGDPARKIVYEPRLDSRWLKIEAQRVNGTWHQTGSRLLADVAVEGGAEVILP